MDELNRRDFLKIAGAAGAAVALGQTAQAEPPRRRPNILIFLTDDHARLAQPAYGNTELHTPNFDRLAASGVRMNNAFTTCPVCSPARASFFTGLMPSQHGIHDWITQTHTETPRPGISELVLLPQLLKQVGYTTGLIGKWHCGQDRKPQPGFDRWFSYWDEQYPHFGEQNFSDEGRHVQMHGRQSTLLADQAIAFIKQRAAGAAAPAGAPAPNDAASNADPFFLFVGYVDTHTPHTEQPEDLVADYQHATFRDIPNETFPPCHGKAHMPVNPDPVKERARRIQYYASVASVDREVGRVLAALDASGMRDDTLVVYVGDHGLNFGQHGMWEKGNATMPQNFLEESIRVPCIISWPKGGILQRASDDSFVNHCDLWATLLDISGAVPDARQLAQINSPGRSYLDRLQGVPGAPANDRIFCEYGNARMMRDDRYKLILRYPYGGVCFDSELYDLKEDPRETRNVYTESSRKDVIADRTAAINAYFGKYEVLARSGLHMETQMPCTPSSAWIIAANHAKAKAAKT